MSGTFEDILHRADRLSSTVISAERPVDRSFIGTELSAQACIDEIFRRSESLWKKKRPADVVGERLQSDLLLGQQSFWLDAVQPSCSSRKSTAISEDKSTDETMVTKIVPLESIEDSLPEMIRETETIVMRDAENAFLNRCSIEDALLNTKKPLASDRTMTDGTPPFKKPAGGISRLAPTSASAVELAFAKALSDYAIDKKSDSLAKGFKEAAARSRDDRICALWEQAIALLSLPAPTLANNSSSKSPQPLAIRTSTEWTQRLVKGSLEYLQKQYGNYISITYMTHMREVVNRNLAVARVGGIPGTLALVDGYLNVKHFQQSAKQSCQDGVYGSSGHPIWEVVYNCLRCGDYEACAEIARSRLQNFPSCAALAVALCALQKTEKISVEDRDRVRGEWRAELDSTVDIYKKAVYCALLGGDVAEVSDNLENWLWLKLAPYNFSVSLSPSVFAALQRTISIDYGEEYFISNGGYATIFFQALWLTGQFERAIHLLFRCDMLIHSVHLAIMAYVNDLLVTPSDGTTAKSIITFNEKDPLECSLDFSRLILIYVKSFECVDAQRAIDYYFCLRKFQSPNGESIFNACVSRSVYLGADMDKVIGCVDEYGIRHPGFIDKYSNDINITDVIAKVATDVELSAEPYKAVRLYHAAELFCFKKLIEYVDESKLLVKGSIEICFQRYNDALRVMCLCLTNALKGYRDIDEPRRIAVWLASIYKRMTLEGSSLQLLTSLYLLIDLSTFFTNFNQRNYPTCLDIITKLKFVPFDLSEVSAFVSMFYTLSDEVRSLLPDVCVSVMRILDQLSADSSWRSEIVAKADAIVAYAARVPYTFPAEVTAQILEINSKLH
ncbi:unnamed protein product [Anisakis simplex]|uniref:Nuclear pore protein n=1 Tax=Anisakis simplex TaxID=6269 RepID=A0A0M3K230_ANISI|nr:unnamed protein product [Anisakis simplex]